VVRKRAPTLWEEQRPEGGIPGATRPEMAGRFEGEQGVKRGQNSEDARCRGWKPGRYGPFVLVIAVGSRTP
jgi:hypothetical protein